MKKAKKSDKKSSALTLRRVFHYIGRHRILLILSCVFALIGAVGALILPILSGNAIDEIIGVGDVDFDAIARIALEMVIVLAVTASARLLAAICNNRLSCSVLHDLRERAFGKLGSVPLSYLDTHSAGDTVSRIISDADTFADGLLLGFSQLFSGIVTIIGTLCFMFAVNVWIALVVVLVTPLSLVVSYFIAKRSYSMFHAQSAIRGEETALISESVGAEKIIRAFGREDDMNEKFGEVDERLRTASQKATFNSALTNPTTRFVNSIVYAAVGVVGAILSITSSGIITVGTLSIFLSYANQYTKPFNEIASVITELQNALACAERIFELIEADEEEDDEGKFELDPESVSGRVTAENVSFSYSPDRELIKNFNLDVMHGRRIAIVGPTGCGKTTLINLLMRFYDVDSGKISVDGHDIREVTRKSLRSSYGMVLQDTWIRNATVRENIAMGKPDATDEEIMAAAVTSHAEEFIRRLPEGLDTVLGEGGGGLSQGQRQLLCISRVMLASPPMLILDEATSSIDTRTELEVQDSFAKMMVGKTSFIVAHRLSTVKSADLILVMRDGKIIETGTHESLLGLGGAYAELYESQFKNAAE
ncbi:MAG: ABC transporter ATP-binding protein/permease [Clostridia bacterium]|nr:ABC transporter ATP-binding protein/permease [Clostridia bacterium]